MRVKLTTKFGQFYDRRLRWGITAGEEKDLPEPLPQDTLTYQKFRIGGFEIVNDNIDQVVPDEAAPPATEVAHTETAEVPTRADEPTVEPVAHVGQAEPDDPEPSIIEGPEKTEATEPKPVPKKRGRPKKKK